jgi:hypothetical protein
MAIRALEGPLLADLRRNVQNAAAQSVDYWMAENPLSKGHAN